MSVPLSSPGHQALCCAVPKSRRLSPNLAVQSQERGSGSGAAPTTLHCCSCKRVLSGFFPLFSSSSNASDLLPGGCPAEVRASPLGHTTSYFSCRARAALAARRDPPGSPPGSGGAVRGAAIAAGPGLCIHSGSCLCHGQTALPELMLGRS